MSKKPTPSTTGTGEGDKSPGTAVAIAERQRPAMLRPIDTVSAILQVHEQVTELVSTLEEGTDYGTIPGTKNPVLLKPGAERLAFGFGLVAEYSIVERDADHAVEVEWSKEKKVWNNGFQGDRSYTKAIESGKSRGLYRYVIRCDLVERQTGRIVGSGMGACSTMESKYVDRPNECENTVLKMAKKRAFVDAVLGTLGLSSRFTQDMEDAEPARPAPHQQQQQAHREPPAEVTPQSKAQVALFDKLIQSHHFTEDERKQLEKVFRGATKDKSTIVIDRMMEQMAVREKEEKDRSSIAKAHDGVDDDTSEERGDAYEDDGESQEDAE